LNTLKVANSNDFHWTNINWLNIENYVSKLQQQIFLAETQNNRRKVKKLQRTLIHSKANILLSIRKVTQITTSKRLSGIDNYKVLTDKERYKLFNQLIHFNIKKLHPLKPFINLNNKIANFNIAKDRIIQYMIFHAIEPQYDVHFEPNTYGFRTGRSIFDAIGSIYNKVGPKKKRKWIYKINIKDCFNINKQFLIDNIDCAYKDILIKWIDSNYINENPYHKMNTPQGRIITPILTNILLHGLEKLLGIQYKKHVQINHGPAFVRYADEIFIFLYEKDDINELLPKLEQFFSIRGINFNKAEKQLVHIKDGFNIKDFNIRVYEDKNPNNINEKLLITPSKEFVQQIRDKLKNIFLQCKGRPIKVVLEMINPVVIKTAYYLRTIVSSPTFKKLDYYIDYKLYQHLKRLHPNKGWKWIKQKYYKKVDNGCQIVDPVSNIKRRCFRDIPIKRHVLISFNNSVYDPSLKDYWIKRNIYLFRMKNGEARTKLALRQRFTCPHCLRSLANGESLELNYILPKKFNGKYEYSNMQLMHTVCLSEHLHEHKTYDDYKNYVNEQKQWYDKLWKGINS